ncbi:MAG: chromosomal replication initiator protein DnaA [Epsilonproteobacteria bacterium]|nr:MAG: chromosomal replication initiator protein DnaA [Campylobacterota bacterium]RLA64636.1 MAG: chromosomal replication initiator protein DnaA [Campylobacterota bacterium]
MNEDFPFGKFFKDTDSLKSSKINNLSDHLPKKKEIKSQPEESSDLLDEILNLISSNISENQFDTFFNDSFIIKDIKNGQAIIETKTNFLKKALEGQFLSIISGALHQCLGRELEVIVEVKSGANLLKALPQKRKKTAKNTTFTITPTQDDLKDQVNSAFIHHMNPEEYGIEIDHTKTFSNFIVGPSNNVAVAAGQAVAKNPGKNGKYPSLYFYSPSGLGKTHLLHAVANGIKENHPSLRIKLTTGRDFMMQMVDAFQNGTINKFRQNYPDKVDVLMIDDIHELKNKDATQNELFHVFNELHRKGKQLIFTSDKPPKEISGLVERLKTRFQMGLVIDIQRPDLETRMAILKNKALEMDLFCPDDVIALMAQNFSGSTRAMEGNLVKLSAYVDIHKIEIDVDVVKELLELTGEENEEINFGIEHIAKATANYYRIPLADLKSRSRSKEIVHARHMAMYLSRKKVHCTQQEIGQYFGGRDHTSVLHACEKTQENLKKNSELLQDLQSIESALNDIRN